MLEIMSGKLWKEEKHWRSGKRRQINYVLSIDQIISCELLIHLDYVKKATRVDFWLLLWFLQSTRGPQPIIKAS